MTADCGGTLRCGIYPQKRILKMTGYQPSWKILTNGKYITEDIYVSVLKMITLHWQMDLHLFSQKQHLQRKKRLQTADKKVSETVEAHQIKLDPENWYGSW